MSVASLPGRAASALARGHARLIGRRRLILALLAATLVISLTLDLSAGPAGLSAADIVTGLLDPSSLSPRDRVVLWDIRLPDALIAVLVGAALGVAGLESQTALNNPLASPFTLGVSAAAKLGAAIAIVFASGLTARLGLPALPETVLMPLLAMAFALVSGLLVLGFARVFGAERETIVLFGVAVMFFCESLVALMQLVGDAEAAQRIVIWTVGNLTRVGWTELTIVAAALAVATPLTWRRAAQLTLLRSGEAQARALGIDVEQLRREMVLRLSALTAVAVCFVGTISFVGLVAPHLARMILGEDHRVLVPGAFLMGGLTLSIASLLSKTVLPGAIIPVGILTAAIGAPALVALLATRRRPA